MSSVLWSIAILHSKIDTILLITTIKNLFDTTMSFIFTRNIVHITSEMAYPAKVAIAAPSIPITGINTRFINRLAIAPAERIKKFGHVFLITKN